ncbi:GNAT family N-acetyltransferase [Mucilaginibacter gossypii]|uniref:GNAT family N-acetyltransferase n=1 Tax=Mucilaginibacter gossypii TaxID=551996 RepID=UPI000DCDC841|nr:MULTISPECIES: GNAT family N-acetyltransferase [Mucilaginibacter]QTE36549.1 GNAT family N-acetyltransferase [Mucilaginibacter gossypii]RAV47373.1 GNAT family N-acetyltransferase [Mucilaginibacter rubeus]
MDTTPVISSLNNTYCQQIIDIILPIQQIEFNVPITLEAQPDLLDIESNYHQTGGNFWGAIYNEQLVGTIALIAFGDNAAAIRKMFMLKEYRGKELGIAQLLLNNLIDYCKQNNIAHIYLGTVEMLKAAHRFYEKNGFTRLAKQDLPESFPLMAADTIFYQLHLNN